MNIGWLFIEPQKWTKYQDNNHNRISGDDKSTPPWKPTFIRLNHEDVLLVMYCWTDYTRVDRDSNDLLVILSTELQIHHRTDGSIPLAKIQSAPTLTNCPHDKFVVYEYVRSLSHRVRAKGIFSTTVNITERLLSFSDSDCSLCSHTWSIPEHCSGLMDKCVM